MSTPDTRTVLVTGATDGLGRGLAHDLAGRGLQVLLHGRDDERGKATLEEIRQATGNDALSWYRADLADLAQVRDLADRVAADHPRLHVLVNNAGIGADVPGGGERQESADGHELRFAVNFLAGHLLTRRLLPSLQAAASPGDPSRIVMVSSAGQAALDFDDLMLRRDYSGWRAYTQSKLAQILDAFDLADELDPAVVTATALHPATYMPTKIVPSPISTIAEGVAATARLAVDPELAGVTGHYFNGVREAEPDPQAHDPLARARLRAIADELTRP
ncbi:SDR family NAD(P)-dependent oxidoreductase [Actinomycetospora straminea]|uniref:SDR family NAD(P)-dependent oxidoreductase n=1 Tax=Actinomycetospora straminea TaxID=663607 RepID=A0ABP9FK94_9PSEU|nr:SDR family NAD(P)-dependent oxidoreductase [Actinomycetospora straminea]MDD7936091.1 SDR family NAD(P)-dependent oxidoreductase [Actinomycetospora straminea]